MIHNTDQMLDIISTAIGGRAYLEFPQKAQKGKPFAVVSMVSTPVLKDRMGGDIMSRLDYTVRVYGSSYREVLDLTGRVSDETSRYGFRLLGMTPGYSDPTYGPYRILSLETILDKRGNTFNS